MRTGGLVTYKLLGGIPGNEDADPAQMQRKLSQAAVQQLEGQKTVGLADVPCWFRYILWLMALQIQYRQS